MLEALTMKGAEKNLLSDVATFVGSAAAGTAARKLNLQDVLATLRGEIAPSDGLERTARFIQAALKNEFGKMFIMDNIDRLLEKGGYDRHTLAKVLKKVGPQVEYEPPEGITDADLPAHLLSTLSARLVENSQGSGIAAVATCPQCQYVHLILDQHH